MSVKGHKQTFFIPAKKVRFTELHDHSVATASRIAAVRDRCIFNVGSSAARGAEIIACLTDQHSEN